MYHPTTNEQPFITPSPHTSLLFSRIPRRSETKTGQPSPDDNLLNLTQNQLANLYLNLRYIDITYNYTINNQHHHRHIEINTDDLNQDLQIQLRQEDVCHNGYIKKRIILASQPFPQPKHNLANPQQTNQS